MGGSAIGGDLVRGIWSDRLTVPLEVVRSEELPAWVGPDSLVVASSKSGGTEETISALSVALERRCPVVVLTSGGPLKAVAERAGLPLATFPAHGSPRSSLGYSIGLLAGILERVGVLALDEAEVRAGTAAAREMAARCAPQVPTADNPAKQLAWALVDRYPVIIGAAASWRRWRAAGRPSSTRTASPPPPSRSCRKRRTTRSWACEQPESLRDHLFVVFLAGDLRPSPQRDQGAAHGRHPPGRQDLVAGSAGDWRGTTRPVALGRHAG